MSLHDVEDELKSGAQGYNERHADRGEQRKVLGDVAVRKMWST
jgi:hypothetical protein